MPASSLVAVQRSPDGRIAMTSSAFATSMPTYNRGSRRHSRASSSGRSTKARLAQCGLRPAQLFGL